MPNLIGPDLQCFELSYFLQEVSDTTNSRRSHTLWAFWILGTCKTYCNQISICTSLTTSLHPFVKLILDHGSQTSTLVVSRKNPCKVSIIFRKQKFKIFLKKWQYIYIFLKPVSRKKQRDRGRFFKTEL